MTDKTFQKRFRLQVKDTAPLFFILLKDINGRYNVIFRNNKGNFVAKKHYIFYQFSNN